MFRMKRIITVVVLCLVAVSMPGCGDQNATYDDDAKIARTGESSRTTAASSLIIGQDLSVSATMTGDKTIWRHNAASDVDVTFSYSLSVTSGGKAKLVLITPDDEVIVLIENADNTQYTDLQSQTVSLKAGKNRIKIVGYDAPKFELKLSADAGQVEW